MENIREGTTTFKFLPVGSYTLEFFLIINRCSQSQGVMRWRILGKLQPLETYKWDSEGSHKCTSLQLPWHFIPSAFLVLSEPTYLLHIQPLQLPQKFLFINPYVPKFPLAGYFLFHYSRIQRYK